MNNEKNNTSNTTPIIIAWTAFVFAALALFFSIVAFNRAGINLDEVVKKEVAQYQQQMENFTTRAEVKSELVALRTKVAAAEAGEDISREVATARENIKMIYQDASAELDQEAREVEMELKQVENDVRTNTAEGLQKLENIIRNWKQDVRSEDK